MANALTTDVQKRIDSIMYPPTHTYRVSDLTPTAVLADRVRRIEDVCPTFWEGERFLDVGASKGFFSLKAAQTYGSVVAVEPDKASLEAWESLCPSNVTQVVGTFSDIELQFDMIWIGNGHHHLARSDHHWVQHLSKIATDRVVIEGPTSRYCRDVTWPFYETEDCFILEMELNGFILKRKAPSVDYTPKRAIWLFKTI